MALGGGSWTSQTKELPGTYINFINAEKASEALSARGIASIPLELDWGIDGDIFEVTKADFEDNAQRIFGYHKSHDKMKNLRELFTGGTTTLYTYRLNSGVKAANTFCTALFTGIRGNDIKTVIVVNVDDATKFDVKTLIDNAIVDSQTVATAAGLLANDYVTFKSEATLAATAGTALSGGANAASVVGTNYSDYLALLESYSFNTLGCPSVDETICALFDAFTVRMRDELGMKFQLVRKKLTVLANHEGLIQVENSVLDVGAPAYALVYWVTGAESGCNVSATLTGKPYTGEYTIDVSYQQTPLINFTKTGVFVFHKVGRKIKVLKDINSFTAYTDLKGKDFMNNQTIRVIDQIANDIAVIFNDTYMGEVPNDETGRLGLWNDIVDEHNALVTARALKSFDSANLTISQGDTKTSVLMNDAVEIMNCMDTLYMQVKVA